ncbi:MULTISPECIES: 50S ribosomal protein L33 [Holospora]|uniref:Large ribosomal subunit protein bL33 n=2 Tax=Holospora TaxID=44747 RepID=A0A061JHX0_9PROT|nr:MULTISPECIES: 50S ribosomal protein L33 [Holospora]ETZ05097.1 50S ribosomal protein L33 [Holospora undulata HU1]GAJ46429.1 50S ribosomal protein L33 [Holospora elegans E1]
MAKKKSNLIRMISTAGTGTFYVTKTGAKKEKLSLKKYDKKIRKHVMFKEHKIK